MFCRQTPRQKASEQKAHCDRANENANLDLIHLKLGLSHQWDSTDKNKNPPTPQTITAVYIQNGKDRVSSI